MSDTRWARKLAEIPPAGPFALYCAHGSVCKFLSLVRWDTINDPFLIQPSSSVMNHHPALLSHFCKRWRGKIVMGCKLNLSPPRISRRCPSPCRSEGRGMMIAKALCSNSVSFRNNQPHGKLLHPSMELDFKSVKINFATYIIQKKRGRHSVFFNNVERSCNIWFCKASLSTSLQMSWPREEFSAVR